MKILNDIVQGSAEWQAIRIKRFTASEAPAMKGASKYQTRDQLLEQKATGLTPEVSGAQQAIFNKGHAAEADARPIAEGLIGEELFPCTCEDDEGRLLASMDGLNLLGTIGWEHKLYNAKLAAQVEAGELEDHYKWQMDQQMLVSGADKILFMVSDGTQENCVWMWYERDEARFDQLLAGWEQFEQDLAAYTLKDVKQEAVGSTPEQLPALNIQAKGEITASNLQEFEAHARKVIAGIKTELVTDQDFADAEQTVKFCKKAEERLAAAKDSVLAQTVSLDEAFRTIDSISEELRQTRLKLDKAVKAQKEARKSQIVMAAKQALDTHIQSLRDQHGIVMPVINADFAGAIKGKKKLDAMQAAVDQVLANAKVEASQAADLIRGNMAQIEEHAANYKFLFADFAQICMKPAEDFAAIVTARVMEHKAAEEKRQAEERERIRQEGEAKVRREAEQKAQEEAAKAAPAQDAPSPRPQQSAPTNDGWNAAREAAAAGISRAKGNTITIPVAEYEQLKRDSELLAALRAAGVDNWSGWGHAIELMEAA